MSQTGSNGKAALKLHFVELNSTGAPPSGHFVAAATADEAHRIVREHVKGSTESPIGRSLVILETFARPRDQGPGLVPWPELKIVFDTAT